jgi:hypothetical protein
MNGVQRAANGMIGAMEPFVELFGTELPNTLAKYRIEVSIDPKFGDFVHEDQVRVPIEFRYGLSGALNLHGNRALLPELDRGRCHMGLLLLAAGREAAVADRFEDPARRHRR